MPDIDGVAWTQELRSCLTHVVADAALAARLAGVGAELDRWESGDQDAGVLAADALDQLLGIVPDLVSSLEQLRALVPAALADLPVFPE